MPSTVAEPREASSGRSGAQRAGSAVTDSLKRGSAVIPALVPGACVVFLAFQAGGFYPASWAVVAAVAAVVLALRVSTVGRPFAGFGVAGGVAAAALALLGAWLLLSATWSDAPGRAVVEFGRLLAYLLILVVCASLAPREHRLSWGLRGVALAIGIVCAAALITRLRPDLWNDPGSGIGRLDFPITYWNGLALLAGVGAILGLHLSASEREPQLVRVLAAALPPIAACTMYLTLSRGGIFASAAGVVVYLLVGFSRATPGALLAIVPTTVFAVSRAYDADLLVSDEFASAAGLAQGRDLASVVLVAAAAAVVLRVVALLIDRGAAALPGPGRLPVAARAGLVAAALLAAVVVAVGAGAPGWAERQVDTFLSSSPAPAGSDPRDRLGVFNNNGRVGHWEVALDAWRADRLKGTGAGTFENEWNREREGLMQVVDAHSLYVETLGEMGIVGLGLLLVALGAITVGLLARLRGPGRPGAAAVLAVTAAWGIHAGVDWDWELAAVTIWLFGLAGLALARAPGSELRSRPMPRLGRLIVALGCLLLALSPIALWRSQTRLADASAAFARGDCRATADAALDSLDAIRVRAEPWELLAYCDVRFGQKELAIGAAEAAVARDPDDWEYHYALALVRGAFREDPRPAAAEALRLNPFQPEAREAVRAFRTERPALWERRARRLPLYMQ